MGLPDASPPGDEENLDGQAGVHTSAPGFRPRMIVLGSLRFPDALRFLGDIGRAALLPHHGEIGSKPELADLGG